MQAVLKVVGGKNDGREIKINVPEFVVGRGEKAHLRPSSDLVSRMHCAIRLKDGKVEIEDLGSRNGSFVNDEKLTAVYQAKSGDRLRIGRLTLEVVIDPSLAGNKKPKVKDVADAAARTVSAPRKEDAEEFENSITDWLSKADDAPLSGSFVNSETVQFSMDDLESLVGKSEAESALEGKSEEKETGESVGSVDADADAEEDDDDDDNDDGSGTKKKKKKKEFGKLPARPKFSYDDSTSAAGDVLKKFFNRR